jgi:hypothetical protein
MSDDTNQFSFTEMPKLSDLVKAAEPTKGQKFANFFGLGYGGNTAVSIASVKSVRKLLPEFVAKWEARHEKKFFDRKVEEQITPIADQLTPEARKVMEDKIRADAKVYGSRTVDSRLLATGGFAMLPFQSAMQIRDYGKNVRPHLDAFRDAATQSGLSGEQAEEALKSAIASQKSLLRDGQKKEHGILDKALDEPKFSPLGPDARSDLPKWIVGRVVALGAAFTTQTIVDDRFKKPKDLVDITLARIVSRISNPTGKTKENKDIKNDAFAEEKAHSEVPEGVDPKVLDVVRMITTDAYMTTVAIGTHMATMNLWDKKAPDFVDRIKGIKEGGGIKGLLEQFSKRGGPNV